MGYNILTVIYLLASVTFILGLKMLSSPATARKGNLIAAAGMILAIVGTIFLYKNNGESLHNHGWIFGGLLIGGIAGTLAARKVKMTAMPEMVSLFNGMGGACAALISIIEFNHLIRLVCIDVGKAVGIKGEGEFITSNIKIQAGLGDGSQWGILLIIFTGLIIGSVSFAGSIVAWGKLNGRIKDYSFKGQHLFNIFLISVALVIAAYLILSFKNDLAIDTAHIWISANSPAPAYITPLFFTVFALSVLYGVFFVLPIGGADMPVVISLLNSFTGVAAACGGFLYDNKAMLTGGILVGAAGTLLTIMMCKAMNRSLKNVLIGSFGSTAVVPGSGEKRELGAYREISVSDAALLMSYAHKVMIVPGYGLAVAQAQHACHELEELVTEKEVEVKYAIHPVAGRMPGHMNVLLAEADVSYDNLPELEQAN